jgi:hypothetical protein
MTPAAEDDGVFAINEIPVLENDEIAGYTSMLMTPYLCPNCANTHFDIQLINAHDRDGPIFALRLHPRMAERLGALLCNPPAMSIEELKRARGPYG